MNTKAPVSRVVLLAALFGTQACNFRWLGKGESILPAASEGSPASGRNARSTQGYGLKAVYGKEDPLTLIARDGTTCTVGREKFESVQIGKSAWCTWIERRR